jgi:cytochrome P450
VRATLEIGTFHLLQQPQIMQKLREELLTVYPDPGDPPSLPVLEQLPYLTAVINECMKMPSTSLPPFHFFLPFICSLLFYLVKMQHSLI